MTDPLLPRSWWNDQAARDQDLTDARSKLDLQERCWNAMVRLWARHGGPGDAPPPSPPFQPARNEETITPFP